MNPPTIEPQDGITAALRQPAILAAVITILVLVFTTRILSGSAASSGHGPRTPGMLGYWLPYFGHVPQMLASASRLLARGREKHTEGVFSLKLLGSTHSFVYLPSLAAAVLDPKTSAADGTWLSRRLLRTVFAMSQKDLAIHERLHAEIESQGRSLLSNESLQPTLKQIKNQVADFVSFNSYPADQMEWERMADADAVKDEAGESAMQVDLTELVKHFVPRTASGALFGSDFVENFPEFWQMLWALDKGLIPLALGIPSWFPWPSAQRARTARRKLLSCAYEFHAALDKHLDGQDTDARWQDLDNVGPLVIARAKLFREHGMSIEGRAACDVALAWDMNAKLCMVVSWMLCELYRDPVFLAQVREEIRPFVKVAQPKNDFGPAVWVPPEIGTIDADSLANQCPLLRAAYLETLRLYGTGGVTRWLPEDVVVKETKDSGDAYLLKKQSYIHIPSELYHLDPTHFSDPQEWKATRHLRGSNTKQAGGLDKNEIWTDSECATIRKPEELQIREALLFTAVLLSLYDVGPPKGQHWAVPRTKRSATVRQPLSPVKVWVKRRNLATNN